MKKWPLSLLLFFTLQTASAQWEWLGMDFEPGEITDVLVLEDGRFALLHSTLKDISLLDLEGQLLFTFRESENDTHCLSTLLTNTETARPAAGFGLSVFPNPASGPVQIRFEFPSARNGRLVAVNLKNSYLV